MKKVACPQCGQTATICKEDGNTMVYCFSCGCKMHIVLAGRLWKNNLAVKQKVKELKELNNL